MSLSLKKSFWWILVFVSTAFFKLANSQVKYKIAKTAAIATNGV